MSAIIDGKDPGSRLIRQPGGESAKQDEKGIWRATVRFQCAWNKVFSLVPRRYITPHPDFNNLTCDDVSFDRIEGNLADITATYAGGTETGDDEQNGAVIEVDNFVSSFPIETHPEFEQIAGTPSASLNGAKFDSAGDFERFETYDSETGLKWLMAGVSTYDAYVQVVRRTSIKKSVPTGTRMKVGVGSTPPVVTDDFEYVKTRASYTRTGGVYVFVEEWTSGPINGEVNDLIYGAP